MRQVMFDRANQRRLTIPLARSPDARTFRRPAHPSVTPQKDTSGQRLIRLHPDSRAFGSLVRDSDTKTHLDPRISVAGSQKGGAKVPVLNHLAHERLADFGRVERQMQRRRAFACATVTGPDADDGLSVGGKPVPQP